MCRDVLKRTPPGVSVRFALQEALMRKLTVSFTAKAIISSGVYSVSTNDQISRFVGKRRYCVIGLI